MIKYLKLIASLVILLLPAIVKGQRIDEFYLYAYNQSLFNPASAGYEDRHIISASGQAFGSPIDISSWGVIGNYEGNIKKINSGIGVMCRYQSTFNYISQVVVNASYNYKIKLNENSSLRIGIRNNFSQETFQWDKHANAYPNDPVFWNTTNRKYDFDLGLRLDIKGLYAGLSVGNVLKTTYHRYGYPKRYLYGTIGKKIRVNKKLQIEPSLAFLTNSFDYYSFKDDFLLSLNNKFIFKDFLIMGFTAQWVDSYAPLLSFEGGVNISDKVELLGLIYSCNMDSGRSLGYNSFEGIIRVKL